MTVKISAGYWPEAVMRLRAVSLAGWG